VTVYIFNQRMGSGKRAVQKLNVIQHLTFGVTGVVCNLGTIESYNGRRRSPFQDRDRSS
jgi:hypothetical protein